jgi:threonylcarbamoyladenosine tRNA methylthiotransferase MtaB
MKYSIVTFGCRVNQADSLRLEEDLRARGAVDASFSDADLVIVNTCSVTATADQGARQTVRRIARENPSACIVVTGCYATRRPADLASLPGVVRVITNDDKLRTIQVLEEADELTTAERFNGGPGACGAPIEPGVAGRTAFTLRVQTGCEERCSYCIIPTTRGACRSMPMIDVVREVQRIARAGFKEIALTGVHLGSYGRDLEPRAWLVDLLRDLSDLDADVTFRISSLEPMDCTAAIVDLVASSGGRFAPHFHLPLQHASDRMLVLMRRPYTLDYYRQLIDDIVTRVPHASIGSDIIVGFPGESDEDFSGTVRYLRQSPLSHLHVFPYSDRPGTEASRLPGKVGGPVVRERGSTVRQIGGDLSRQFYERQIGDVRPGLTLEDGSLVVTDNYLKVRIPPGEARNRRVDVRLAANHSAVVVSREDDQTGAVEPMAIASRRPGAAACDDSVMS